MSPARPQSTTPPTTEGLFRNYSAAIYRLASRMLSNEADAEDATQEVFLRVFRKLPEYRGDASVTTWLYRTAVNVVLNYRRHRTVWRQHEVQDPDLRADRREHLETPETTALDRETRGLIEQAVGRLPGPYREVYSLGDIEGLPASKVAELLGLTVAAVNSRLHRARLLMRRDLKAHFGDVNGREKKDEQVGHSRVSK